MNFLSQKTAIDLIDRLAREGQRFFFAVDFLAQKAVVGSFEEARKSGWLFDFDGIRNFKKARKKKAAAEPFSLKKWPESLDSYQKRFEKVKRELLFGNSFLANLTAETPIETEADLPEIFENAAARFRLLADQKFVCFSPEEFVRVSPTGRISSFPMKGTIDAAIENAAQKILADEKEAAEHATIVDLIRNDLSIVAERVRVKKWRFLTEIQRHDGQRLLQVSSQIEGRLLPFSTKNMGKTLFSMLPAGSISGAPKRKTIEIIRAAEPFERGFFTGVAGVFTGRGLEMRSAVLIRFIEKKADGQLVFRSGGGLTHLAEAEKEWLEMQQKIYLPR